jgi:choline dehydrogenase
LLLEAGGSDRKFWIKVPLGYAFTYSDPRVNWRFNAAADPGLNGREAYFPRGKVIGGSSSINAMAYLRGLPHDFDDWEQAGAKGWNWSAVQQTYDALETTETQGGNGQVSTTGDGPLWVGDLHKRMHPFSQTFLKSAADMGWPVSENLNTPANEGLTLLRSTVRNGRRWSAADAFLRPAQNRPNLRIVTHAHVERVTLSGKRATGVVYRRHGTQITAKVNGEVILSAGAILSPQLLQLSGIGPAKLLAQHGIAIVHDLPRVGQGLQDHLAITHYFRATVPTLNNRLGTPIGQMLAGLQYLLTRRGPLSVPVNQCSGFVRSDDSLPAPDLQLYANPASYVTSPSGKPAIDRDPGFLLCVQPSRPTSRGSVTIASPDPMAAPIIQPNALSTNTDRDIAVKASKLLQRWAQSPTIRAVTKEPIAPDITSMDDDALLENFRERAGSVFHASCTCAMGKDTGNSVLDAQLRVHGIDGLRVVDASAFPNVTSGNTNAPTLMLAARAAALILKDAR